MNSNAVGVISPVVTLQESLPEPTVIEVELAVSAEAFEVNLSCKYSLLSMEPAE